MKTEIKTPKWNTGHFPIGTIVTVKFSHIPEDPEKQYTVSDIIKNGVSSYCIETNTPTQYKDIGGNESFNISHVTSIIKRGTGKEYCGSDTSESNKLFLEQSAMHSRIGKRGTLLSENQIAYYLASGMLKDQTLLDLNKLIGHLFGQGVFKKVDTGEFFHTTLVYNKKRAKKAVKRLLNKCLIKHKVALKEEEDMYVDMMENDFYGEIDFDDVEEDSSDKQRIPFGSEALEENAYKEHQELLAVNKARAY